MKLIFFTKLFKSYTPDELVAFAKEHGLDGFDLAIRPDYPVNEENITTELVPFAKRCRDEGLSVELATIGMRPMPLDDPATDAAYAACAEAGVGLIKLGYDVWDPERPWRDQYAEARGRLESYVKLALKHGVKVVLHTHSGPYIGLNASSVRHLVDGLDPKGVGAYLDFAHLAADGESPELAIAIAGEYLSMVAAKNMRYVAHDGSGGWCIQPGSNWKPNWCRLAEGIVSWRHVVDELQKAGYGGDISLHGEYSDRHGLESALEQFLPDIEFMRALVDGAQE